MNVLLEAEVESRVKMQVMLNLFRHNKLCLADANALSMTGRPTVCRFSIELITGDPDTALGDHNWFCHWFPSTDSTPHHPFLSRSD
ncbi:putative metallohydrolase YodQ [Fusarium oxysporum f. sp. albedinis]|nr:putative metallohydrolase YodQ [Fusarium oxysporum f. sp. albedinis]